MGLYFLDSSAVVKRYVQEIGTAWLETLADPNLGNHLFVARITEVEVTAALARRRRGQSLTMVQAGAALQQFQLDLAREYRIVEVTLPLLQRAARLADFHHLRAHDAVQLAAALELYRQAPTLAMLSADAGLNAAASAEGLSVDDPNLHP